MVHKKNILSSRTSDERISANCSAQFHSQLGQCWPGLQWDCGFQPAEVAGTRKAAVTGALCRNKHRLEKGPGVSILIITRQLNPILTDNH